MNKKISVLFFLCLWRWIANGLEKWIVVTTIQAPTDQLRTLATIPGWHLVVVGDLQTPVDWHLENCIYLSVSKQLELEYDLAHLLPWNHYSRKNIGYLYAIEHGADVIYDTDDDNVPVGSLAPLEPMNILPSVTGANFSANIYAYFGRPDVWPRGFPLDFICDSEKFSIHPPSQCRIAIEQGMVNGDPDTDAIYRLTQGTGGNFETRASCFLPSGTFCPINSQNTFFQRDAFFTLYLPSSVHMRISDIWRGLIAQRLIWEMNSVAAFSGPNAYQDRNIHSLLKDFINEYDLYVKSGRLIHFLTHWMPSSVPRMIDRDMQELIDQLVKAQFFEEKESTLIRAWLHDLKKISLIE